MPSVRRDQAFVDGSEPERGLNARHLISAIAETCAFAEASAAAESGHVHATTGASSSGNYDLPTGEHAVSDSRLGAGGSSVSLSSATAFD